MIGIAALILVWMTYVEVEMPNRTNECPYDRWECPLTDEERAAMEQEEIENE
jgi:hypothetical protein